ncbi:hypothetical protein INS49_013952 [Diaporthe citri]|uniref:uncharacterized protein n=1 Tax=Diaporthe citri TaxID=83186 RepID=UPI001C82095F|nr:uncharacterized protein INS49_013952 [Diaporthe citri]KAG6358068.1 hypothetical protein INS49_013952 [Diaporthe citri]
MAPPPAILPSLPIPGGAEPRWKVAVMPSPHGCPEFFTPESYTELFTALWTVHYNSNRSGVGLKGPAPEWARADGGSAGLHPSKIHDSPYAIGSSERLNEAINELGELPVDPSPEPSGASAQDYLTSEVVPLVDGEDGVVCRPFGDRALLLEFGQHDGFNLRQTFRIMSLVQKHELSPIPNVEELVPGVRTLLVMYRTTKAAARDAVEELRTRVAALEQNLPIAFPSRRVRLPFVFDDSVSQAAVDRYIATIRSSAPYLPHNVEFLRQLNFPGGGIGAIQEVLESGDFLVLGLGDVFMGSPCSVPLDPRHRLFGTKYNPSRSYTPRNSVGIRGQYTCIYATDSPGGYQLVGRTAPIWDADRGQCSSPGSSGSGPACGEAAWRFYFSSFTSAVRSRVPPCETTENGGRRLVTSRVRLRWPV